MLMLTKVKIFCFARFVEVLNLKDFSRHFQVLPHSASKNTTVGGGGTATPARYACPDPVGSPRGEGTTFQVTFFRSRSHRMRRAASGRAPWRRASGLLCGRAWLWGCVRWR